MLSAMPNKRTPIEQRFWAKVIKSDGCWAWNGAKHPFGYGMLRMGGLQEKTPASRVSWRIHFGEIPRGMYVCHKCDNPECTNPDHLFLGTARENSLDKESKMRGIRRLSQSDCNLVATLRASGVSYHALARAFQCDRNVIKTALRYGVVSAP